MATYPHAPYQGWWEAVTPKKKQMLIVKLAYFVLRASPKVIPRDKGAVPAHQSIYPEARKPGHRNMKVFPNICYADYVRILAAHPSDLFSRGTDMEIKANKLSHPNRQKVRREVLLRKLAPPSLGGLGSY